MSLYPPPHPTLPHLCAPLYPTYVCQDRRRNRLSHDKANLLVGLFHNLRLLKRMKKPSYSEPAIAWGDDLEKSHVTKYNPASGGWGALMLK